MTRRAILITTCLLLTSAAWGGKPFVAVPDVDWAELKPYVEANIRVRYEDGKLTVGASGAPYERKLFEPYDPALGEFATVLLVEGLSETKMQRLVEEAADALKTAGLDVTTLEWDELTDRYWQELTKHEQFLARLETLFRKARARGRIECHICGEGFAPKHIQIL